MQERKLETPSALRPILKKKKKPWPYIKSLANSMQTYSDVCFKKKKQYIGRIFGFLAFI